MKLAILCQKEPVYLGPFLRRVMALHPRQVVALFVAGRRSAGERRRTWRARLESLATFWLILEPWGFVRSLGLRLRARLLGPLDPRSVVGMARRLQIPVYGVEDPNAVSFRQLLRQVEADVVLNQSELLLRGEVLSVPRLGFLNRHASLLPRCRGRLASFWSHAAETPEYGVTIHRVDEGIDTGPILLQRTIADVDPRWSYPRVMECLFRNAHELLWQAVERLERGAEPEAQPAAGDARRFPTLAEARRYRQVLAARRRTRPPVIASSR